MSDWPWILQGEVEIAWARLGPRGRQEVDRHTVVERTAKRVSQLRQDVGFPNRAFLARTEEQKDAMTCDEVFCMYLRQVAK